eukprot:TRINITY_DN30748_c0_g1_i1.p1 TRINITY_DN30748_c0_g1~~TRINITY_DN30748_c0_g1_i1.p1  ORF type:complete len:257 (-),score=60.32 TRINITY_DN30748_c0_g1_i1:391-1161(-)
MAKKAIEAKKKAAGSAAADPAVLSYASTDFLSLAICGYIGGRYVLLKSVGFLEAWSPLWVFAGVMSALVTSFGGGTYYALLMKKAPRSFAWQDPMCISVVLVGYAVSLQLPSSCPSQESMLQKFLMLNCEEAFAVFDYINCAILVAWGTSKSLVDTAGGTAPGRLLWAMIATYLYSFGGGITRDFIAIAFGVTDRVGNFDIASIVAPLVLGVLLFHIMLVARGPSLMQMGLGLPALFLVFSRTPAFVTPLLQKASA